MDEKLTQNLINDIFNHSAEVEQMEKQIEKLKQSINELNATIDEDKLHLLNLMKEENREELKDGYGLVAQYFKKNEFSYGDEKALLNKLRVLSLNQYIKFTTKVTESIDKNALKKDLKTDNELKETLKDFVGDKVTEYVVVTTEENHQKMLEHIEENKKK